MNLSKAVRTFGLRGLAGKLGVSPSYLSMVCSGQRWLSPELQKRIGELVNTGENVHREKPDSPGRFKSVALAPARRGVGSTPIRPRHTNTAKV